MPFVHVVMEPRDEESKHRISRELCDAMAECTNNSLAGTFVIFHEVPMSGYGQGLALGSRRTKQGGPSVRADYVTVKTFALADEQAYLALRSDRINPTLARQDGFVSTQLLRLDDPDGEYLLLEKWLTKGHAAAWLGSVEAQAFDEEARALITAERPTQTKGADVLHQQFGPRGGSVLDGTSEHPQAGVHAASGGRT